MTAPLPTPMDTPRVTPAAEWLHAFVPLGLQEQETWTPCAAGVLVIDNPVVWLLTARRVLDALEGRTVAALFKGPEGRPLVLDLTTGRGADGPLPWLRHPELDLAALIVPIQPGWQVKAFTEARCLRLEEVEPLQRAGVVSAIYGLEGGGDPRPAALDGAIARVDPERHELLTSAPLLPRNAGAPLVVALPPQSGGGVSLAGVATHTIAVPEPLQSSAAPVRLTAAVSISAALGLLRGQAGRAQRARALAAEGK